MKTNPQVRSLRHSFPVGRLLFITLFLSCIVSATLHAQEVSYEAEAGSLAGGAGTQTCSTCSGGTLVGYLGGTTNGSITRTITAASPGTYILTIYYAAGDPRTLVYTVNGSAAGIACPTTGDWSTVGSVTRQITLNSGNNTLRLDNNAGWAPNVDRFTIASVTTGLVFESESGIKSNGANNQSCAGCSGTQMVGNLGGTTNGTVTHIMNASSAGIYNMTLAYASADPRTIYVAVNNGTPAPINCSASGGWSTAATTTTTVALSAGVNTIRFDNANGWGPNLDKVTLTSSCTSCILSMSFGTAGKIDYNLNTGTFSVRHNNLSVIADAYAAAKNGSTTITSRNYTNRSYTQTALSDALGSGTKYTITLTGNSLPQMQQVFCVYPLRNYYTAEVSLSGTAITSNYMAPLVSNNVDIQSNGDNRVIFTPFDNDTFIRYDARSMNTTLTNTSAEVTAIYENTSRNGLVVGSLEHLVWKTGVRTTGTGKTLTELTAWGGYTDAAVTRDNRSHGSLSGTSVKSPRILVGYYSDWRAGMEDYGKAVRLLEPPYVYDYTGATPFGWNSWGAMQSAVSLTKAKAVVDFFYNSLPTFRNGNTAYIDIDSYWDNLSTGGLTGDFSQLTEFANYCKSKGLKPGIYWAPFVDWGKFERPVEGSTHTYSQLWTNVNGGYHDLDGCRALDPTHPGTRQRLAYAIGKFKACGFEMIKIDFIGHAAVEADSYYDTTVKTGMQAFRKGMEYLIDQLDDQMVIYAAISPSVGTSRYAHMRRIACDAYSSIGETQYTLNSTNNGWWQTYIYDYIDADHLVLGTQAAGANRARAASGVITGTVVSGDDFSTPGPWIARAQSLFQNQAVLDIARSGVAFAPIEGNAGNQASELFGRQIGSDYYLAVFNYGTASKAYSIPLTRIGLNGNYSVTELFSNTTLSAANTLSITLDGADAAIYRFGVGASLSVATTTESAVLLYPNPATGVVNIKSDDAVRIEAVSQISGRAHAIAFAPGTDKGWSVINLTDLPPGIYVLRVTDKTGQITNHRLIKN